MTIKAYSFCGFSVTLFESIKPEYEKLLNELLIKIASHYTIRYDQSLELLTTLIAYIFKLRVIFNSVIDEQDGVCYLQERWRIGTENPEHYPIIEILKSTNLEDTPAKEIEAKITSNTIVDLDRCGFLNYSNNKEITDVLQSSLVRIYDSTFFSRKFLSFPHMTRRKIHGEPILLKQCKTHFAKYNNLFLINVSPIKCHNPKVTKVICNLLSKNSPMGIYVLRANAEMEYDPVSTEHILLDPRI